MKYASRFFKYARDRHSIYLDRVAGKPEPWTKDKILGKYRFTNVFRELDKTTVWFRENVRDPMNERRDHRILLATVVFRLLNRIEVGEAVFRDDDLLGGHSAFDSFAENGDVRVLKNSITKRLGKRGPFVTGAYIISSPRGYTKLDGVLQVIKWFYRGESTWDGLGAGIYDTMGWGRGEEQEGATNLLGNNPGEFTLEATWEWLRKFDYLGKFHSYEIVTDLRHTYLLDAAPDIMSWANPGPGAKRGLNRVMDREYHERGMSRDEIIDGMRKLLLLSTDARMWPSDWTKWEMRDVEHTLCEFDKYERVRNGQGKPRGVFR